MSDRTGCKVDDVVDKYDVESRNSEFEDIHGHLLALWKGEAGRDSHGYRSLTEWFNKRLLKCVYSDHGRVTLGTRLENDYETLTSGDEIARGELLDELAHDGIDSEQLVDDIVSWSTMRRHLQDCLGGNKPRQSAETDWERESVSIATEQLTKKVQKALSSYENKGEITGATDADITIQVQLSCPECPTRRSLSDALRLGYVCRDHLGDG